eukprot:CAMPEP_0179845230 /NCGR_PEP_ID=MMETSP0982-20121206/4803_1 /TAXON_ID=483367 /ORGANISM="non described non described, Strain CCMP 2436" /LENGTH=37 /DNA_ID= /DNA_START= /DNA_END= /DNA_ORIENTATION=
MALPGRPKASGRVVPFNHRSRGPAWHAWVWGRDGGSR